MSRPAGFDRDTLSAGLHEAEDALHHSFLFDHDTGLLRPELFLDRLTQAAAGVTRGGASFAVLLVGVVGPDDGSLPTDTLQALGHRLVSLGRRADSFTQLGQDSFAGLLLGNHSLGGSVAMAQKIIEAMAGSAGSARVMAGVAMCPQHGHDAHTLLLNAHTAMTHAHSSGQALAVYASRIG